MELRLVPGLGSHLAPILRALRRLVPRDLLTQILTRRDSTLGGGDVRDIEDRCFQLWQLQRRVVDHLLPRLFLRVVVR